MAGKKLTTGELVVLKSGGPQMVVVGDAPKAARHVVCSWFLPNGQAARAEFHQGVLDLADDMATRAKLLQGRPGGNPVVRAR